MESIDLKSLWQKKSTQHLVDHKRDAGDFHQIILKKSEGILTKITRTFHLEIAIGVLMLAILFLSFLEVFEQKLIFALSLLAVTSTAVMGFYIYFGKILLTSGIGQDNLKTSLVKTIERLTKAINLYYYYAVYVFPILFFALTVVIKIMKDTLFVFDASWQIAIVLCISIPLLMHKLLKWLLAATYGKHLEKLRACLVELNSQF